MEPEVKLFSTVGCSRCHGEGHKDLSFKCFMIPVVIGDMTFKWWATCPVTGEPILLTTMEDGDTAKPIKEVLDSGS